MDQILIIDQVCLTEYDSDTFNHQLLGGSESTVVRVAEALKKKVKVFVAQKYRLRQKAFGQLIYTPYYPNLLSQKWKAIIVLRRSKGLDLITETHKETPIWVWLHDLITPSFLKLVQASKQSNVGYVVVSEFHRQQLIDCCKYDPYFNYIPSIETIYNPIADDLMPDETPVDKFKLMFGSTAIKGFDETLKQFKLIHAKYPEFKLVVTYDKFDWFPEVPGVTYLGGLSHEENIEQLRSSLCLLSINSYFAETFGLAMVEANAVGRPVLAHPNGALPEVLIDQSQFVNTHDSNIILEKLLQWQKVDPKVTVKEEFRLSNVIKEWERILEIGD